MLMYYDIIVGKCLGKNILIAINLFRKQFILSLLFLLIDITFLKLAI